MKKLFLHIVSIVIVGAIIVQPVMVFATSSAPVIPVPYNASDTTLATNVLPVIATTAFSATKIEPANTVCTAQSSPVETLMLNQPADCFTISITPATLVTASLVVVNARVENTSVNVRYTQNHFAPPQSVSQAPVIPEAAVPQVSYQNDVPKFTVITPVYITPTIAVAHATGIVGVQDRYEVLRC